MLEYKFFNVAINNMDKMYKSIYPADNNFQRVLLLTESKDNDFFPQFKMNGNLGKQSEYKFENTSEDCSLILKKDNKVLCYIMAGRQIVTREKLEILSIASSQKIEDGLPIDDVLKILLDNEQTAVLAWGIGKWFFKRGKIIKGIIEKYHSPYLFIGDNSARPSFWPKPKLYLLAEKYNVRILKGSDPLPYNKEACRVGTFGFVIEGNFQAKMPAESFRNILISNKSNIIPYGQQDSTFSFLRKQAKLLKSEVHLNQK